MWLVKLCWLCYLLSNYVFNPHEVLPMLLLELLGVYFLSLTSCFHLNSDALDSLVIFPLILCFSFAACFSHCFLFNYGESRCPTKQWQWDEAVSKWSFIRVAWIQEIKGDRCNSSVYSKIWWSYQEVFSGRSFRLVLVLLSVDFF